MTTTFLTKRKVHADGTKSGRYSTSVYRNNRDLQQQAISSNDSHLFSSLPFPHSACTGYRKAVVTTDIDTMPEPRRDWSDLNVSPGKGHRDPLETHLN